MSDPSTFRTAVTPSVEKTVEPAEKSTGTVEVQSTVEAPYSEFEKRNGKPYPVEYFDLGKFWDTGEIYTKEVASITTLIDHLIHTGELNNTTKAVSNKLKSIEKMINVNPDDRRAARVAKVAAYAEFLIKVDNIKKETAKYGMI